MKAKELLSEEGEKRPHGRGPERGSLFSKESSGNSKGRFGFIRKKKAVDSKNPGELCRLFGGKARAEEYLQLREAEKGCHFH